MSPYLLVSSSAICVMGKFDSDFLLAWDIRDVCSQFSLVYSTQFRSQSSQHTIMKEGELIRV